MGIDQLNLVSMVYQVNVQDAKTRLSELLARVEQGEEVTIARGGKPIARLLPLADPGARALGFAPGHLDDAFFDALSVEELAAWENPL